MSNLDNLISKILSDCEEQSKKIIAEANEKASAVMQESIDEAEKEKAKILKNAETEADKAAEQIISGKKLEIRDGNLKAKQAMIDKVFDNVLNKLNSMSKEEYWEFLRKSLPNMDLEAEQIILPSKYNITGDELNAFLKENKKEGKLRLFEGERDINGGFVLIKGGIENNNTFETLVEYYRYELEGDIIENLF